MKVPLPRKTMPKRRRLRMATKRPSLLLPRSLTPHKRIKPSLKRRKLNTILLMDPLRIPTISTDQRTLMKLREPSLTLKEPLNISKY